MLCNRGLGSIATRGCIATAGVFPLQPWDALQPWDVFGTFGKKEGMVKPSLLIFNQRFRAGECGYVCGFAPRNPAPGRAPQGG